MRQVINCNYILSCLVLSVNVSFTITNRKVKKIYKKPLPSSLFDDIELLLPPSLQPMLIIFDFYYIVLTICRLHKPIFDMSYVVNNNSNLVSIVR